jgi:hypothetical protein
MATRKTDDIDIEWLRAYLKRKYRSDVLKKFDQDCIDYEAGDVIYDPLGALQRRFSNDQWKQLRAAWRKYRNRERNITSPVDVPINAAYAIGKLRAACNEHHLDIGDAIMVLAGQLGQSDDKNNLILGEIRAFRRVMEKTDNS